MHKQTLAILTTLQMALCTVSYAQVGINMLMPQQSLDVNGKIKIADDSYLPQAGTIRYDTTTASFQGHDGSQWMQLNNNQLLYQDQNLSVNLGSTIRNSEEPWGDTITIPASGNYLLHVSAYFSSAINEEYETAGTASTPYDIRGRLRISINGQNHKLLECGNSIIDRDNGTEYVSFAPGTRSHMEVLTLSAGDFISLTRNMQAVPASIPNISIPYLWSAHMDAFFIMKLD